MEQSKKYELLNTDTIVLGDVTLYRIKALISFGAVKKGELGGYVEKESNLCHSGNAWVSGNAKVNGDAEVKGDARVYDNAWVTGNAKITGNYLWQVTNVILQAIHMETPNPIYLVRMDGVYVINIFRTFLVLMTLKVFTMTK